MPYSGLKISRYCSESCKQKAKYKRGKKVSRELPLSRLLDLSRPYDWSNKNIQETVFLSHVLKGCYVPDITKCAVYFGKSPIMKSLEMIDDELTRKIAERQVNNVFSAMDRVEC